MKPFYVTTPIYYVNDRPHIGTAYSTIAADVLARYHRLRGRPTYFLTGLDEHGLKIERRAREEAMEPQAFVDRMAPPFVEAWKKLDCKHDDFIRTSEGRHQERAQELWRRVKAAGDIYLGHYEDWYCVGCESFYTEKDLLPGGLCPAHKKPVERVKEASYFFRLSEYTDKLLGFYEKNPTYVQPESRFNEVKAFVREGLRDISISRTSFKWGVPVPDDPDHVMWVWFDALPNYISALGGPPHQDEQSPLFERFWADSGEVVHLVGKDILRFHAVFWPAFLMSAGLQPPTQVWAHGWLTVNGEKMSKSLGNFLSIDPLVESFGPDVLRFYLMRDVALGQDGDFNHRNLLGRYHGDLGNGLGNLLNRIVSSIARKNLDGKVPARPEPSALHELDQHLVATAVRCAKDAGRHMDAVAPHRALETIWELVGATNRYVDQTTPWALAKEGKRERLEQVVYAVLESLRWIGAMVWPFMPRKADALREQLGLEPIAPVAESDGWPATWGLLEPGTALQPGAALFPRFDKDQEQRLLERLVPKTEPPAPAKADASAPEAAKPAIAFDDFVKVDLRVGLVQSAERVPKSDKLLRLLIELGEDAPRQVLAGLGKQYTPEDMEGRRVVVVANLKPRKMMGLESRGMVLAAGTQAGPILLSAPEDVPPGSAVS